MSDGIWHVVKLNRHGYNFILEIDDGDLYRRNESLHFENLKPNETPEPLSFNIDPVDGVTVGGTTKDIEDNTSFVSNVLKDSECFYLVGLINTT